MRCSSESLDSNNGHLKAISSTITICFKTIREFHFPPTTFVFFLEKEVVVVSSNTATLVVVS